MDFALSDITDAAGPLAALAGLVATAILWRLKGEFASKADLQQTRDRLDTVEAEIERVCTRLEMLPDHEDLSDVRERLASMEGAIKVASEQVEGLRQVMVRLERPLNQLIDHHMNRGRG